MLALRVPIAQVLLAAADAAARNSLQTPLRGGETPNMNLDRATSAMPSSSVAKTPSLKDATGATPARAAGGYVFSKSKLERIFSNFKIILNFFSILKKLIENHFLKI